MQTFRQVYFLILAILISNVTYPTNHYVDKNVSSSGNGSSWATAWKHFSNINWSSINPGDVVYISGGTDSTFYYEQLNIAATGSPGNLITIRAGLDAGHNGRVIIDAQGTREHAVSIDGGSSSGYLRIIKLEGRRSSGIGTFSIIGGYSGGDNITKVFIDSCRVTDQRGHGAIAVVGMSGNGQVMWEDATSYCDSIYIRWCYLKGKEQYPSPPASTGEDIIFLQSSKNVFIQGNTIVNNNGVTTEHSDCIQAMYMDNVYAWHNRMYTESNTVTRPDQVCMYENMRGKIVLYGNELYSPNHVDYMNNFIDKDDPHHKTYYVINNVFYGGSADQNLFNCDSDTAYCYNNIFQHGVPVNYAGVEFSSPFSSYTGNWAWTDGNLYGDNCGNGFYDANMTTMNSWGAETSGNPSARYLVDPLFVDAPDGIDKGENVDFHLQPGSPAINAGVDVQNIIEELGLPYTDIDGNSLDSTPDCGAYQYSSVPVELISFTGNAENGKVTLSWKTGTETNNFGFEIERKQEKTEWEKIGFIEGFGTTTEPREYSYTDDTYTVQTTLIFYRLRQIDFDGSFKYSDVVQIGVIQIHFELTQNYPNPFNPTTTIMFALPKESNVNLSIFNVLGELVATLVSEQMKEGYHEFEFNASNLSSGTYLYRIQADDFVETKKMILIK